MSTAPSIPSPPKQYDAGDQLRLRAIIQGVVRDMVRQGGVFEVGGGKIILKSDNGTRYILTVADDGTLGTTAA